MIELMLLGLRRMSSIERVGMSRSKPDFGTYHHSNAKGSEKTRTMVKHMFIDAFGTLPFARNKSLRILDVGCGLGFLSCVAAEYYKRALVTGIDLFDHPSLKDSSLSKARENAEILGLSERIKFRKADVFNVKFGGDKFDVIISSLVFHNFGRKRFDAYSRLASWTSPSSFVVMGDLFFHRKADLKQLSTFFRVVKEIEPAGRFRAHRVFVLSKA